MKTNWGTSKLYSLLLITFLLFAIPAYATFPGKNGRIAFVQDGEIFTMNPDGSDAKQLTHLGPDNSASWPAWSADGKQIVFNEFPTRKLHAGNPAFSPDGSKIMFNDGAGNISIMNADGSDGKVVLSCTEGCPLPDWGAKP